MFEQELRKLEKRIKKLVHQRTFEDKDVYLFGVSDATRHIIKILRSYKVEPKNVIDNDARKQNGYCMRIKVISPEDIEDISSKNNLFILYSGYWREMESQLKRMDISKSNYIVLSVKNISIGAAFGGAIKGRRVYKRLVKKYGNLKIFLCPYTGTGDIYLIGTYWKQYCQKEQLDNYIFLVVSGACKKVATIFDIPNVEILKSTDEVAFLISYYMLCPDEIELKILNDSWAQVHINRLEWLRGYKGLDFNEMFRRFVFDLPETEKPQHPILKNVDDELEKLFIKYNLVEGRTIILSPYSNTLADLSDAFWEQIAQKLQEKGYVVCTNSSNKYEPAVKGTEGVFFPLHIASQFVSKAGGFIGIRSGFCDIISASSAKKVILYDKDNWFYNSSAYDYFSLRKMKLCDDALEINFQHEMLEECQNQIVDYMSE